MIPFRNVVRNKLRSTLTIFGVAVGVVIFLSLTSISSGLKGQIQDSLRSYRVDITIQSKEATSPFASRISAADYRSLHDLEGVRDVSCLVIGAVKTAWNPYFVVMGISSKEAFAGKVGLLAGKMFEEGAQEALLGQIAVRAARSALGGRVTFSGGEAFTVSGIFSSGSKLLDNAAVVDIQTAQKLLKREEALNMAFVSVNAGAAVEKVVEEIQERFPKLSAVPSGEFAGEIKVARIADVAGWTISLIALTTSCIVVMNTLVMAVSERTKEIGILMAVGWSRRMIIQVLVAESLILCLLGAILGNGLGLLLLWSVKFVYPEGVWLWTSSSSILKTMGMSMGLSVLLGLLASIYPAFLSIRLLPAEALRYE